MKTWVGLGTGRVVTVKVVVAAPAGTVATAGPAATAVLVLWSVTLKPPGGAGPDRVTVPIEAVPPGTLVAFSVRAVRVGGDTASVAVLVTPPYEAVIVTVLKLVTGWVLTMKGVVVAPAKISASTVSIEATFASLLERLK